MASDVDRGSFIWDSRKEATNIERHGLDFSNASLAFFDPKRVIAIDALHSVKEERFFCLGRVGSRIATVRFTYRKDKIRIIGAGFWRKGRKLYEIKNKA